MFVSPPVLEQMLWVLQQEEGDWRLRGPFSDSLVGGLTVLAWL